MRRRDAFVIGGAIAVAVAIPPILRRLPTEFDFEPLPDFPGFRRLSGGEVSGALDPFIGLSEGPQDRPPLDDGPIADPCRALFGPGGWRTDSVPVAIFTDINCPYCKVLERDLMAVRDQEGSIELNWHEMPLLGPSSLRAARAILAARFLDAEDEARAFLANVPFPPGPAGLRRLSEALGVSPDVFAREEQSARVSQALNDGLTLGTRLGIPGTPGTVIGRTLVIGAISKADLRRLIALEAETPQTVCV